MCQKRTSRIKNTTEIGHIDALNSDFLLNYTPAVFRENKCGDYVEFYAFDPTLGELRRKRIKLGRVKGKLNRRRYAAELIKAINSKLLQGWNPWIDDNTEELDTFESGLERYEQFLEKMMRDGVYRKETYAGYRSYLKMTRQFIKERYPLTYMYQFNRQFCSAMLDWVFVELGNGAQTRNNYLNFLRVLSGFFVDKGLQKSRATDGISPISKRLYQKERKVIPADVVGKISEWCRTHDPHFALACALLYYCFIRPVEMTRLKIGDFHVTESTITIPAESSKNKRTQTITVPNEVMRLAIELGVLSKPVEYFLFSEKLRPGKVEIDPKIFRDHWEKVRKALDLRREWKFYSLKDTGITEMCDKNLTTIEIRDQARHTSLAVTDLYTRKRDVKANQTIKKLHGSF